MVAGRLCGTTAALIAALTLGLEPSGASARAVVGPRVASASAHVVRAQETTSTTGLDRELGREISSAGGNSSALVVDTDTGRTLYSHDPTTARLPASVEKLFTTSAALFDFGYNHRFETDVDGVGSVRKGVFSGTLYLKGGGDPTFGDQTFDTDNYGRGVGSTVQGLLRTLHSDAGINEITGAILGDATIFDDKGGGPASDYRPNLETEGDLSGLSYDDGFTSGSETALQPRPGLWATQAFAAVAPSQGITIAKGTRISTAKTPAKATLLARVYSPTLTKLIKLTNTPSNDFFAETLTKDLGHFFGAGGTTPAGATVVEKTVSTQLGLSELTNDGSGLSRADRTTATDVVDLLEEMQPSVPFYNSLAVAGVSGTMQGEMLGSTAVNNCRGKTGTLHDVANLVGFCTAANGDLLAFAFLENSLGDSTFGHDTEDLMGEALAAYDGRGNGSPAPVPPRPAAGAAITATGETTTSGSTTTTSTTPGKTTTTTTPGKTTTKTTTTPTTTVGSGGGGGL
jgi:D-alanyl-D-alanine carboxypeptidase/D-alanyl-D-alanine-endopeptidase (penicillin-binding protein 4)